MKTNIGNEENKLSVFFELCDQLKIDYNKDELFVKKSNHTKKNYDNESFEDPWKLKDRFLYIG